MNIKEAATGCFPPKEEFNMNASKTAAKTPAKRAPRSKIAVTEVKAADLQPITRKRPAKAPKISDAKLNELEARIEGDQLPQDNKAEPTSPITEGKYADKPKGRTTPLSEDGVTKPHAEKAPTARPDSWKLSTTEKPTKKVWNVADSMPGASRKDVIAACVELGIAPGTSRTQYQAWFKAMRDSGKAVR